MLGEGEIRLRIQGGLQWHGDVEPCFCGGRISCRSVLPSWSATAVRYRDEPAMRCYPALSRERCVQSSLPCVSSSGKKSQASKLMALSVGRFLWKDCLQKRIETGKIRCGNHLGCPSGAEMGLRYGLSGNRVSVMETDRLGRERETASFGDERFAHGENKPDLSRKINHFCRHCCFLKVSIPSSAADDGSFPPRLRCFELEIHKVFLRSRALPWRKISRHRLLPTGSRLSLF